MAMVKKDYSALTAGLEQALRKQLQALLDGAVGALDGPVRRAAEHMSIAVQRNRPELAEEARDTLLIAIQTQKLEAKKGGQELLNGFLSKGIGLLVDGAIAGIGGLKVHP